MLPLSGLPAEAPPSGNSPFAIPTFHCLGLYWSPPGGTADRPVLLRFRRPGAAEWQEGLPMRYNPIANTDEDLTDYRGSIVGFDTGGNHVIRYNECYSDLEHMYNDGIGGGGNGSFRGSPGPDSDIYGNLVSHCWDDGLEVEGGSRNVRVWNNYIAQCMMMIGNAPASIGPLYIWGNVVALSQSHPGAGGGNFLKMGYANSEDWMTGHMYIFHNTLFGPDEWLPTGGLGGDPIPNFSPAYTGRSPDIGAHQRGAPPMQFGVHANQP